MDGESHVSEIASTSGLCSCTKSAQCSFFSQETLNVAVQNNNTESEIMCSY